MVIDNYHNPAGKALAESLGVKYCLLINFPGKDGSVSLEDVYLHNEAALLGATVPGKR
jgi:zinc transport system substrate-binding protein/iron/zinc/copper transport system substrate-binding protein